jgi:predicted metal-dependent peptidase
MKRKIYFCIDVSGSMEKKDYLRFKKFMNFLIKIFNYDFYEIGFNTEITYFYRISYKDHVWFSFLPTFGGGSLLRPVLKLLKKDKAFGIILSDGVFFKEQNKIKKETAIEFNIKKTWWLQYVKIFFNLL